MQPVFDVTAQDAVRHDFSSTRSRDADRCRPFRVGDQPYGVLLTSDFSKWEEDSRRFLRQNPFYPKLLRVAKRAGRSGPACSAN